MNKLEGLNELNKTELAQMGETPKNLVGVKLRKFFGRGLERRRFDLGQLNTVNVTESEPDSVLESENRFFLSPIKKSQKRGLRLPLGSVRTTVRQNRKGKPAEMGDKDQKEAAVGRNLAELMKDQGTPVRSILADRLQNKLKIRRGSQFAKSSLKKKLKSAQKARRRASDLVKYKKASNPEPGSQLCSDGQRSQEWSPSIAISNKLSKFQPRRGSGETEGFSVLIRGINASWAKETENSSSSSSDVSQEQNSSPRKFVPLSRFNGISGSKRRPNKLKYARKRKTPKNYERKRSLN